MKMRIRAEWDGLREVMIHTPAIEVVFGLLEPETFLYERYFRYEEALDEHRNLKKTLEGILKDECVKVYELKKVIIEKAKTDREIGNELIRIAFEHIRFAGRKKEVIRAFKRLEKAIERGEIDLEQLINLVLLNPTVRVDAERPEVICTEPLANLVFVRDQQVITDKGAVIGRMCKSQRRREVILTKLALKALGANIVSQVKSPGFFEGGDFLPMKDFALIGVGARTNRVGVRQILNSGGLGFNEVGVVSWPKEAPREVENDPLVQLVVGPEPDPQVCMHLDTYLNVASDCVVIGYKPLLKTADLKIWQKITEGQYEEGETMKLIDYLKVKEFHIVEITTLEQMCYASNFLCLKNGLILAVDVEENIPYRYSSLSRAFSENPLKYAKIRHKFEDNIETQAKFFPERVKKELKKFGIEFKTLALPNMTGGYGGIHCMTCALSRG